MSTTAASTALRRCLRSKSTVAACRKTVVASRQACIASSICPARTLSSATSPKVLSPQSSTQSSSLRARIRNLPTRRHSSSIQGTIGAGQDGIASEALREQEALQAPEHLNEKEKEIWGMLQRELSPTKLEVSDVSGGCGSMYAIEVESERFRGLSMLRQQRLVNQVLGEEIKGWHGVQLRTSVP